MKKLNLALEVPTTRRDSDSGYTLHGQWFDDPYAWLERLDDAETQAWIAAQEAATQAVLRAVPGRDWLRAAVARSARYGRLSPPIRTGPHGREFLWQADADDDKLKLLLRRGKGAPLETVLDPNTWASDEALVFAAPSPDGALVAFGKAVGSTHDATIQVLDVETGQLLPDRPRGTSHASLAWRPDGTGVLLRRVSRAWRGACGRGGALERDLRASDRVGRASAPDLWRRPCEGVLVLGQDQRVWPLRRALQVGLCTRQRRLSAAPRRRRARAGGPRDAVDQPGAGDRG